MISVIIPVYRNKELFLKNFKNNLHYLEGQEIIIVNDNPQENLDKSVKSLYPQAIVINNAQNYGFGKAMNTGVKKAKNKILLFLNSDVRLLNKNYEKSLKMFENKKIFALSFAQIEKDGRLTGANGGHFKQGLFHHFQRQSNKISQNLWPEGGSCLIRKEYFQKLGGYDNRYLPFYWEDVDLGFRANKKGWQTLYYPLVKVEHHHQSTISLYFNPKKIKTIAYRNQFLFVWKNIRGFQLINHLFCLPLLLLKNRNNQELLTGFKKALIRLKQ
jgi:GT2 family glycosyltransferase